MEKEKTTLNVRVFSADGNPIDEKSLTKEQINFCAKVAAKKYKLFSASKVRKFDAEEETIDVTLPEDIENVNIDEVAQEAAEARDAEMAPEEVVTEVVDDDPETDPEEPTEIDETKVMCNEFAAKLKKFTRKMRKFTEEEVAEVKEELNDVLETVKDIIDEDEPEMVDQVKEFTAKLRRFNKTRKFSSEDLKEVEELEEELQKAIDEDPEVVIDDPKSPRDGVKDLREFAASKVDAIAGEDSIDSFKARFFASCKK